jgi:hypothetical protein
MKNKKDGYSIYSLNALRLKKLMLKSGIKVAKKMDIQALCGYLFSSEICGNLDRHLCVAETLWNLNGRHVLFPGEHDFYNKLLKSNYSIKGDATLNLPYQSFILAMPKGFTYKGVSIPSVLINYCRRDDRVERYDQASKAMKVMGFKHDEMTMVGQDSLSYFFQNPYEEEGVITQVNQTMTQISGALTARDINEYAELLGKIPNELVSMKPMETSEEDKIIQFVVTKIIAGLSVYLSAKGFDQLKDGLPNKGVVTLDNYKTDIKYNFSHLHKVSLDSNSKDGIGTRTWFFRNLKNEVYYKNEYERLPVGSRWVFVSEAKLGNYCAEHVE